MKDIKKLMITLVALLAVTTGAWALDPNAVTAAEINADVCSGWKSIDGKLFKASELPGFQAVTEDQAKSWTGVPSTGKVVLYYEFVADGHVKFVRFENGVYDDSYEENDLTCYLIYEDIAYMGETKYFYTTGPAPAASTVEVAWNQAEKSGSFNMPGGNVTLEPEYYPQAAVADGGVTAADADARATTDDPLVKVDATKLTGAKKLMYFVSTEATAPAYDAVGWTDQLPTAEGFTQQGIVYVWYYPVGTDEGVDGATATYSDGDIKADNAIAVTIAAAPTYAVTFAEGTDEPTLWTASPAADVTKGQTVTVSYSGTKKVLGVKAEKKAAEPVADIVWDVTNVSDLSVPGTESYEKEGVTLSANAHMIQAQWYNYGDPTTAGIGFNTSESGGFTFTAPTGKAFTKIEMTLTESGEWQSANLGTGWAFNADMEKEIFTVTWTGSAASTVDLLTGADDFSGANVKSIAFYLSE